VGVLVAVLVAHGLDGWLVGGGLLLLAASFALTRGFWLAWVCLTVVAVGDLVSIPFRWPAWWPLVVNAALLALLLAPPTRRYARRRAV
jgi:membrane protein implicated in regulation of membrane protease activity